MSSQFSVQPDISFEQAIVLTQELLTTNPSDEVLESTIAGLIQTINGARGFFVTFLTGDNSLADSPSAAILKGLRSNPKSIADLMTKNIAMPTAMAITHERKGNLDLAASSKLTQIRSINLVHQLDLPEIYNLLKCLQVAIDLSLDPAVDSKQIQEYQSFLERWGYDEEQRIAIFHAIAATLASDTD